MIEEMKKSDNAELDIQTQRFLSIIRKLPKDKLAKVEKIVNDISKEYCIERNESTDNVQIRKEN